MINLTFLGIPVLPFRPNFIAPQAGELDDATYDSTGIGKFTPWKPTSGPRRTITYPFLLGTQEEIKDFRLFVNFHQGSKRAFWVPLYLGDYRLTADAAEGATVLTVEKINLDSAFTSFAQFGYLSLLTQDGLDCYGIVSVVASGNIETITISPALPADVEANVTVCCGLIFARFDKEPTDYTYESDSVVTVKATFIECPNEYTNHLFNIAHQGTDTGIPSAPVLLYRFTRSGVEWRYAGWGVDVQAPLFYYGTPTWDLMPVWTAADISSGSIRAGMDFLGDTVEIMIGTDDEDHPLRYYKDRTAMEETECEILRLDIDGGAGTDPNPTLLHKGTIEDVSFEPGGVIRCRLSSIFRIGESEAPRPQHTRLCQHRLFDEWCGLDQDDYEVEGIVDNAGAVSGVNDNYINSEALGAEATAQGDPNWFALGRIKIGDETRLITGQVGNKVYINAPFGGDILSNIPAVVVGTPLTAWPGCDKRKMGGCTKFNNVENFLGFDLTPNNNIQFQALTTPKAKGGKKDDGAASDEATVLSYNPP